MNPLATALPEIKYTASMKKQLLLVCTALIVVCTSTAFAQLSVGVSGGYTKNYLYTNAGYRYFTKYDPGTGFSVGVPIRYSVNSWLAFQADPQLIQKNYQQTRTGVFNGIYQATTNQYLQLPIMGHFSFGGQKLRGFLNLGGYVGYWATSASKGVLPFLNGPVETSTEVTTVLENKGAQYFSGSSVFDTRRDRRLEVGLLTGIGLGYQAARYNLFVEGRSYQALSDQQKDYMLNQIPRYNQTYVLQIGCLYQLNLR